MLAIFLIPIVLPSVPRTYGLDRSITLVAFTQAWNSTTTHPNPTITVNYADQVSLTLIPGDTFVHRFFIDVDNSGTKPICPPDKCSATFSTPNTIVYTFTADLVAGKVKYYCAVHPTTMTGTFVIAYSSPWVTAAGRGPMPE